MLYHMVVARKEVLVQLDDELLAQLDRIAVERGVGRSDLLRRLVAQLIVAYEEEKADTKLVAAYEAIPPDEFDLNWLARNAAENALEW